MSCRSGVKEVELLKLIVLDMKTIDEMKLESDLPVLIADCQGLIVYVNEPFNIIFGWQHQEILGHSLEAVIPRSYHDSHHLGFSRFVMTEKPTLLNHPLKLMAVTKDGREIESEHFIIAEQQQGEWLFAATLRPLHS